MQSVGLYDKLTPSYLGINQMGYLATSQYGPVYQNGLQPLSTSARFIPNNMVVRGDIGYVPVDAQNLVPARHYY